MQVGPEEGGGGTEIATVESVRSVHTRAIASPSVSTGEACHRSRRGKCNSLAASKDPKRVSELCRCRCRCGCRHEPRPINAALSPSSSWSLSLFQKNTRCNTVRVQVFSSLPSSLSPRSPSLSKNATAIRKFRTTVPLNSAHTSRYTFATEPSHTNQDLSSPSPFRQWPQ